MVDSRQQWKAWLYLLPALILLAVFTVYPIINTVRISLLDGYSPMSQVGGEIFGLGISNFIKVVSYIIFTHYKAIILDISQIFFIKILCPIKGNITSLNN